MTEKPAAPSQTLDKFILRLPDGMREEVARRAKAGKRSMNAEIVQRLESYDSLSAQLEESRELANALQKLVENQQSLLRFTAMHLHETLWRAPAPKSAKEKAARTRLLATAESLATEREAWKFGADTFRALGESGVDLGYWEPVKPSKR